MLKRLELVGFKSFADKTQFEFGDGITAIVGPNGSGKSNIVDAVRWTLGEQSAKSLRGGEMADVIFNGSASRRSLGMAEVTLVFDNSKRLFEIDSEEIQITRRVYRDGTGEYLINQQPSRLKDIKQLLLGSGAGGDAYCIIEQGKVDVLLQSSTKERRTILEEAAGISRFKAKKTETLRKLERVDQNVQRLRDIVDEVEKQLRSVKLQAAKAQRYQEYSNELKELRLALGLRDFHFLTKQLDAQTAVLEALRAELNDRSLQAQNWESESRRLDESLLEIEQLAHEQESLLAGARERIASEETTWTHEWGLSSKLEADMMRMRRHLTDLSTRVASLAESARHSQQELEQGEALGQEKQRVVDELEKALGELDRRLAELQQQLQQDQSQHLEKMREAARLHNDAVSFKAQVDNLERERQRLQARSQHVAESLAHLDSELESLHRADSELQEKLRACQANYEERRQQRQRLHELVENANQNVRDRREQRSALLSRIEVLEGLERSREGLSAGVREIMDWLEASPSLARVIHGMVADFLEVRHEYASLVDLVLGDLEQHFLVTDSAQVMEALAAEGRTPSGRVSFLEQFSAPLTDADIRYDDDFVAYASELVSSTREGYDELPARLLGNVVIVRDLAAALRLGRQHPGYRFVTLQGELLEPNGSLTIGPRHAEDGILFRKSELRELRQSVVELDQLIAESEKQLRELREEISTIEHELSVRQEELKRLGIQSADLRQRINQHQERRADLHEEVELSRGELSDIEREIAELRASWQQAQVRAEQAEQMVHQLHERMERTEQEIRAIEQSRHQQQAQVTTAKVAQAQVEERLAGLRSRHRQISGELESRRREFEQAQQQLLAEQRRWQFSQFTMLQASANLATAYLEKEAAERRLAELARERDLRRQERQLLVDRSQSARHDWQAQQEQAHAHELQVNDLRHQRDTLVSRILEDYQIDLGELYAERIGRVLEETAPSQPTPETEPSPEEVTDRHRSEGDEGSTAETAEKEDVPQTVSLLDSPQAILDLDTATVNEQIAELRRKLGRLGNVNLEALDELAELENRAQTLQSQYADLIASQRALQEIIDNINRDSRRLFTETYHSVRTHFQELFRKLFGGGMADIVLEDENDVLESGIEIIAKPPGKELSSISLLSGGEKTLTAVALLLAIFRSKPSPFCILDEVDAALDETNIGRYTGVLREFLDRSQFIIITHSKKTMAAADVLYGITMQESGISKRVAIRFEDWPEDDQPGNGQPAAASMSNGA
ncbi:MAG: chromosome partition protein Smc [Gemmatales bacterium]|nr:MAG: chromosome partition protein Smc [Gemmatales bacterium]